LFLYPTYSLRMECAAVHKANFYPFFHYFSKWVHINHTIGRQE
jgi:hypothetical protein